MNINALNADELVKSLENRGEGSVISAIIILFVGLIVLKILMVVLRKILDRTRMDKVLHNFVLNCIKVAYLVILGVTVLSSLGIPTSTFVTVLASMGIAIALALKDSLTNFAGGMLIMLTKPFSQGDLISTNGVDGRVQHIDLLNTKLLTLNYRIISIPNGMVANNTLINYSASPERRIDIQCGIAYGEDIARVRKVVFDVIAGSDLFLQDKKNRVGVAEHGDNAIILDIQAWCHPDNFFDARYYLREEIVNAFAREGIEIPFPQLVIHGDIGDFE